MRLGTAATVADYRRIAARRLPGFLFHYIDGAAGEEITAAANRADLTAIRLKQRVMIDVDHVDTAIDLLGERLAMPVLLGPVGLAGLFARRGEVQAAAAARKAGVPFCLSTLGICALPEVTDGSGGAAPWFQLYMMRDRSFMVDLLAQARGSGVRVLVLTVDVAVSGIRHRDRRSGLTGGLAGQAMQALARPSWLLDVAVRGRPMIFGSVAPAVPDARSLGDFWGWLGRNFDPTMTWADLDFIRAHWNGPIVVKGIMQPEDARIAVAAGADAVVVSNHGGRQLDGVRSTTLALPAVAAAVDQQVPLLVDGGIHSGIDVVRALAGGADACMIGRAWAYALAAGGRAGVAQLLADMKRELANTLALTGCTSPAGVGTETLDV